MSWPYLSRRLGFDFPKAPGPRQPRPTDWGRIVITGVLALALSFGVGLVDASLFGPSYLFFWLALYYGWPLVTRRLTFLKFLEPKPPVATRPLWLRLVRGTFACLGGVVFALVSMGSVAMAPLFLCHHRAQKVHDAVHIGMTVPEVLAATKNCDIFQASSNFPHDDDTDPNNIPAMSMGWSKDGVYHTYDLATGQTLYLSESDAIDRLHAKLHDGSEWHFRYTYLNLTPQHVSFSVVIGPDGRVSDVKPVYGWD
jgi:hypothetical protein